MYEKHEYIRRTWVPQVEFTSPINKIFYKLFVHVLDLGVFFLQSEFTQGINMRLIAWLIDWSCDLVTTTYIATLCTLFTYNATKCTRRTVFLRTMQLSAYYQRQCNATQWTLCTVRCNALQCTLRTVQLSALQLIAHYVRYTCYDLKIREDTRTTTVKKQGLIGSVSCFVMRWTCH
jgi:hypothetical protein